MAAVVLGALSLATWLAVLVRPGRPWLPGPFSEDMTASEPARTPSVAVIVPARNEARTLPRTLPSLLAQRYPVFVVDDRSDDRTAEVGERLGATVVRGGPLPAGWVGKVWALDQGTRATDAPDYLLLTDADIRHAPGTIAKLVAEAEADGLLAFPPWATALGAAAWLLQAALVCPTVRYFRLSPVWALTLPLAGLLYGAMAIDSELRPDRGW